MLRLRDYAAILIILLAVSKTVLIYQKRVFNKIKCRRR